MYILFTYSHVCPGASSVHAETFQGRIRFPSWIHQESGVRGAKTNLIILSLNLLSPRCLSFCHSPLHLSIRHLSCTFPFHPLVSLFFLLLPVLSLCVKRICPVIYFFQSFLLTSPVSSFLPLSLSAFRLHFPFPVSQIIVRPFHYSLSVPHPYLPLVTSLSVSIFFLPFFCLQFLLSFPFPIVSLTAFIPSLYLSLASVTVSSSPCHSLSFSVSSLSLSLAYFIVSSSP